MQTIYGYSIIYLKTVKKFNITFKIRSGFPLSPFHSIQQECSLLLLQHIINCSYCIHNIQFRYVLVSDQHLHALTKRFSTRSSSFCCLGSVCSCSACARLSSSSGCRRSAPSPPYSWASRDTQWLASSYTSLSLHASCRRTTQSSEHLPRTTQLKQTILHTMYTKQRIIQSMILWIIEQLSCSQTLPSCRYF